MGGFGNVGIGLAKMMEGVSGGAVAGKQMEYQDKRYQEQRADQTAYNDARVQNETNRLKMMAEKNQADSDLANQRIAMEKRRVAVSTISTAYEVAKGAPDPKAVFKAIQERLNPGEPVLDLDLYDKSDKVTISFPGDEKSQGWKFTGPKDKVSELLTLAKQAPNRTQELVQKAASLGVIEAVVIPFKPVKKGGAAGGGGKAPDAPKISEYNTYIKMIGDKYGAKTQLDTKTGSFTKEPTYAAIKRVIAASTDPAEKVQAKADLKKIDYYYSQIEKKMGVPEASQGSPGVPGRLGKMGGKGRKTGPVPGFPSIKGQPDVTYEAVYETMANNPSIRGDFNEALRRIRKARGME